jgi:hypothetical protein
MSTKSHPGPNDAYMRAKLDEPMFTLLARDVLSPHLVRLWALGRQDQIARGERPDTPEERKMIEEAHNIAAAMAMWRIQNNALAELEG